MRILFMGTPAFAVPCLQALLEQKEHSVVCIVTRPDKPNGRGHKMKAPPVKELALQLGIPVLQPTTLREDEIKAQIASYTPDVIVVVAYGMLLPKEILTFPPFGCINLHASLLPKYRGAGPIAWCLLNGEEITGVSTMQMAEGLDTGDMLLCEETPILLNETAEELQARLATVGAGVLLKTLTLLKQGGVTATPQEHSKASYAPMLSKALSPLVFTNTAEMLHNQIRGLSPWPCAQATLDGKRIKVYRSEVVQGMTGTAGSLLCSKTFVVGCGENTALRLLEVQLEGGKRMSGSAFLSGYRGTLTIQNG